MQLFYGEVRFLEVPAGGFSAGCLKDTKSGLFPDLLKFVTPHAICHSATAPYAKCDWALQLKREL